MKISTLFYREQAATQQNAADDATLDNVRDRCQRAANSWTALAERQTRADALHQARLNANAPGEIHESSVLDLAEAVS